MKILFSRFAIALRLILLAMLAATLAIGILVVGMTSPISLIVIVLLPLLPTFPFYEETRQKLLRAYSLLLGPTPEWLGRSFIFSSLLFGPVALIDTAIFASIGAYGHTTIDVWEHLILTVFTLCIAGGIATSLAVLTFMLLYKIASRGLQALSTRMKLVR